VTNMGCSDDDRSPMKSQTQNSLLFAFIGSIVLCGLIGLYCVVLGSFGSLEARILGTTGVIGAASILALASAIPWERKRWPPVGLLGMIAVFLALIQSIGAIWIGDYPDSEFRVKALAISCVFAVALPHVGLLSLARLRRQYSWVRIGTIACITLLAGVLCLLIIAENGDDFVVRAIGALSILVVCGTISVPILHRVSGISAVAAIRSATREISLTCPRCGKPNQRPIGRSSCPDCNLVMNIEIDEEHCRKCGYVLYGAVSSACPECGEPIAGA